MKWESGEGRAEKKVKKKGGGVNGVGGGRGSGGGRGNEGGGEWGVGRWGKWEYGRLDKGDWWRGWNVV